MTMTHTPEFFVPHAEDNAQSESVWDATVKFLRDEGFKVLPRRIYSLRYRHEGKPCFDVVGGMDRYNIEEIWVLLETDIVFLCCTKTRGVARGHPIFIGKGGDVEVTEFAKPGTQWKH
jgi:hypothetical protein